MLINPTAFRVRLLCFAFVLPGLVALTQGAAAQDALTYQTPPKVLADLVTVPPTPTVSVTSKGNQMLIIERASAPSIAELAQPELKLAGLRINPANFGPSRANYITGLKLKALPNGPEIPVKGLPANPLISYLAWSPDETRFAFAVSGDDKIELYVATVATATATRITDRALNAAYGAPFQWVSDSKSLIVKLVPQGATAPAVSRVPVGPTMQDNSSGKKGQAPTYQDLLKNPSDEKQFAYYTTAQVARVGLDGSVQPIGQPGIIATAQPSPDGKYVMVETVHTPFSYLVPVYRFPLRTDVFAVDGPLVKMLNDGPLQENVPYSSDGAPSGPRDFEWRTDKPASVYYTVAQDKGDPKVKADVRDRVFLVEAPFTAEPKAIYDAAFRFRGFTWGDANTALATERWWQTRQVITKIVSPANNFQATPLFDYSFEDRYANPGEPDTKHNEYGREVLNILPGNTIMLVNQQGASPEGDRPFVSVLNLTTKKTTPLWRSEAPVFERPIAVLDAANGVLLTTRETPDESPNYFIRTLKKKGTLVQVTQFSHPYPQLKGIQKQQLRYKRPDGVDLTAMLYLPAGYKKEDGPLPTFLWAYPAEFKSKEAAGQVSGSPYQFNRISYWGAAAFVTMGYAILDNASIPIVGEGDKEPNDTYVEQLVASAKAAIDEGVRLGVVDASRVGVGGHSYGAFMTANLLTHSNLFRGGIARSGAYNRTLTPFGFQNEQRSYWQAPDVYNKMSPFMNADKMKTPLLLVHGEADNNTGTFPIQSERYYNALKGFGATTRLVFLPYESHGYTAKESLLHMLWEMNGWLDKYVKKPAPTAAGNAAKQSGGKE